MRNSRSAYLALWLVPLICVSTISAGQAAFTHGVASGDVTTGSVILWARAGGPAHVMAEVSSNPSFHPAHHAVVRAHAFSLAEHDFTIKVKVDGLQPSTRYYYRFRSGHNLSDTGTFTTAPLPSVSTAVRFTWSSDTDGSFTPPLNQFEALDRARDEHGEFFIYLGDTVYMDTNPPIATGLPAMRAKYRQVRDYPALRRLTSATSTYAIWDDHEIADDFAGQTVDPALLSAGIQAFEEYQPVPDWAGGFGFYRTFRWGKDLEFFILDERSFRSGEAKQVCQDDLAPTIPAVLRSLLGLSAAPPAGCLEALLDPSRTMLGAPQKEAFLAALQRSDATWKIIVNEVAFSLLAFFPYDRWEGYASEREELLGFIRDSGIKNVVFLTGDLHANLISSVRSASSPTAVAKEFITGPVAQVTLLQILTPALGSETDAANFLGGVAAATQADCFNANAYSYGVVDLDGLTKNLSITLKDGTGATLCSSTLTPD